MYQNFFGFKEKPFKLIPNPTYHFLSKSHEEAMAHLTYAVSQGDGFVEITGEVGTGKTTLCRTFLENLSDNVEAALIFNPKLDSLQLLKAINDEFGIPSDADNTKELIDALNGFLMSEKAKGKIVVLLIDEAHNLDHSVLEQIRLLSNLETTQFKLLQIIIVGQPELRDMLNSRKLRQLGQRITLSCSLKPLTYSETQEYIQHRISIASKRPGVRFPRAAVQTIYKYSKGIPRLVNIACDRTLLTAFGMNQDRITGKTAKKAIRELTGTRQAPDVRPLRGQWKILTFAALCLVLFIVVLNPPNLIDFQAARQSRENDAVKITRPVLPPPASPAPAAPTQTAETVQPKRQEIGMSIQPVSNIAPEEDNIDTFDSGTSVPFSPEPEEVESLPEPAPESEPAEPAVQELGDFLKEADPFTSRQSALDSALDLWRVSAKTKSRLDTIEDIDAFFRLAAKQNGLRSHRIWENLELIKKLNLPAILEFTVPNSESTGYLTLSRIQDEEFILLGGKETQITTKMVDIESYWSGVAYVPWKNFLNCTGTIPDHASEDSIITLKMMLTDIGFDDVTIDPVYDEPAREAVIKIQRKHGLVADGVVGPLTKIVLYNEYKTLDIPHIRVN